MNESEPPTPAELAARIEAADRRTSKKREPGMRFQWDVPRGEKPDVTFAFAALVIGLLLLILLLSWLQR